MYNKKGVLISKIEILISTGHSLSCTEKFGLIKKIKNWFWVMNKI